MSEEWPLHVRVADALGCQLEGSLLSRGLRLEDDEYRWLCLCEDHKHARGPRGPEVAHYDTDWSATGPLIEKYGIGVFPGHSCEGRVVQWDADRTHENDDCGGVGAAPLLAVCSLILALKKAGAL